MGREGEVAGGSGLEDCRGGMASVVSEEKVAATRAQLGGQAGWDCQASRPVPACPEGCFLQQHACLWAPFRQQFIPHSGSFR